MATNGPIFLKRTKHEFVEDLQSAFGDKSEGFTDELRVLLFELWVRARSRPPFPIHRPEPTDEMKQAELVELLTPILKNLATRPGAGDLRRSLVQVIQQSIITGQGISRLDSSESLELKVDAAQQFSQQLFDCLQLEGGLEKTHDFAFDQVKLELSGGVPSGASIPELEPGLETDDDQGRLERRLENLNVMPPADWVPVFQHERTGSRAGIDRLANQRQFPQELNTYLVHDGAEWLFPHPRPIYTFDECTHIRLWVDEVEQANSLCTWTHEYDNDVCDQVVTAVVIVGALNTSQVRAVYSTIIKEYGL